MREPTLNLVGQWHLLVCVSPMCLGSTHSSRYVWCIRVTINDVMFFCCCCFFIFQSNKTVVSLISSLLFGVTRWFNDYHCCLYCLVRIWFSFLFLWRHYFVIINIAIMLFNQDRDGHWKHYYHHHFPHLSFNAAFIIFIVLFILYLYIRSLYYIIYIILLSIICCIYQLYRHHHHHFDHHKHHHFYSHSLTRTTINCIIGIAN